MAELHECPSVRRRVYNLLDGGTDEVWGKMLHRGLVALVIISVICVVLESVQSLSQRYHLIFLSVEIVAVIVFTCEYLARVWSAPEHPPWRSLTLWQARLKYLCTPGAIIDLMAIAPLFFGFLVFEDLRVLVLFRLLRFFKLARYSPGMSSLLEAVYSERRALGACFVILMSLVLFAAALMHIIEGHVQPDKLGSIPDAAYWAIITLGTVGYGDVTPVTPLGKLVASITALFGLAMFALPVGIIATAFAQTIQRRDFVVTWSMVARVPIFAQLGAAAIADIMRYLHSHTAEAGEIIIHHGDKAHGMFFIASGDVKVQFGERSEQLGEGQFFGELAVLMESRRMTTVVALSRVKLLALEAADLRHLMDRRPEIGIAITQVAEQRLSQITDPLNDLPITEQP